MRLVVITSFLSLLSSNAFNTLQTRHHRIPASYIQNPASYTQNQRLGTTTLAARRGKKKTEEQPVASATSSEIDYGEIAGMLVNPLNPYSWFLYFFLAINAFAYFDGQS